MHCEAEESATVNRNAISWLILIDTTELIGKRLVDCL